MQKMRSGGKAISTEELLSVMKKFKDDITLDGMHRDQLVSLCNFLGMPHYVPTAVLRFQLRRRMRTLRNEDKEILWEGVHTLRETELRNDLRARGIPTHGLDVPQMRLALSDWLVLSKQREIAYSLLILTNMLRFAQLRDDQQLVQEDSEDLKPQLDIDAAQAALSSIAPETVESALNEEAHEKSPKESLEALMREEALVEEERQAAELLMEGSAVDEDVVEKEHKDRLSREQIEDIDEAVQTMSAVKPMERERENMRKLEEDHAWHQEAIDEAVLESAHLKQLDSSITRMIQDLRVEMDKTDGDIGQAFRSLDLDDDGVMSHEELLQAMSSLDPSKKPDEAAFRKFLKKIDWDQDGKITLKEWREYLDNLRMKDAGDEDEKSRGAQ